MKPICLYILSLLLSTPFILNSQTADSPKLRWGIGGGVNATRIAKGMEGDMNLLIMANDNDISIDRVSNPFGYQLYSYVAYRVERNLELVGVAGITKVRSEAIKETDQHSHFFGLSTHSTYREEIKLNYLFLDVKTIFRVHLKSMNAPPSQPNFFIDLGGVAEFPLVNKATYTFRSEGDVESFETGSLCVRRINYCFGLGLSTNDYIDIALDFTPLRFESSNEEHTYKAILTQLSLSAYF